MIRIKFSVIITFFSFSFCYSQTGNVGINTTSPTATIDVNGTARARDLINASNNVNFVRNAVADINGNLGRTNRISKPTPPTISHFFQSVNAYPVIVANGVSLTEFTPVITSFVASNGSAANVALPTYTFRDSGGNILFDMIHPASSQQYNITFTFIRNN